ncbi:hypothetical protein [Candidatus Tisiphia endosymbiont of Oplodontha viridula]|uniref:hypothetical protein n=1 Tax=Candidatus Tisiphia endosymbiont of Oplodontha viridula TaxID=3077925 RepID=UPI0035C8BA27
MKGLYQGDISPLSSSITGFADSLYTKASSSMSSLWQCGIGGTVGNLIQSTENGISNCFWQGISNLPRNYFVKDITEVNYYDKNFWEGVFNDQLELIEERLLSEIEEDLSYTSASQLSTSPKLARVDKLKEQMAAGLSKSQASLEEQLIQLQGLVGKYTVSPVHYEQSLDNLQQVISDNSQYKAIIEKIKESFRSELKVQPEFLTECLQGEVLHCFQEGDGELLTAQSVKDILNYYKPLMQHKTYMQQQHWLQQCYEAQAFLLPP